MTHTTNQMSREDMLRELELLPIWQLRSPMPPQSIPDIRASLPTAAVSPEPSIETAPVEEVTAPVQQRLRVILADDGILGIVMMPQPEADSNQSEEALLANMLHAMRFKPQSDKVLSSARLGDGFSSQIIISLGADAANILTGQNRTLESWRSRQQETPALFNDIPMIVTYSPAHLLLNPHDKKYAWADLCLALKLVQAL